jgi:hypothetical protein
MRFVPARRRTTLVAAVLALCASPALAQDEPVLRTELTRPAPVAAGGTGTLTYKITNVSKRATEGVALHLALPEHVSLDPDGHCKRTGRTDDGGTLIRCDFTDAAGEFAPGESRVARTPFHVDGSAPASATIGRLGALVVPLGDADGSSANLSGPDTTWTPIRTAAKGPEQPRQSVTRRAPAGAFAPSGDPDDREPDARSAARDADEDDEPDD